MARSPSPDGVPNEIPFLLRHHELVTADVLRFALGPEPSAWGTAPIPAWVGVGR